MLKADSQENLKQSWIAYRNNINNNYSINTTWRYIINEIFQKRIRNYYFNPIESIIKIRQWKWEWFSIVWLECILIETIWAFEKWEIHTTRQKNLKSYEYNSSKDIFTKYFTKYFSNFFDTPKSKLFFTEVRCWILHEGRTKWNWKIRTRYWKIDNERIEETIINCENSEKLIYRNNFYYSIERNFNKYIKELLEDNHNWETLRKKLWRKLDHMFEIPESDRSWFDWWNES